MWGMSPPSPHPLRCWEWEHLNKTNSNMLGVSGLVLEAEQEGWAPGTGAEAQVESLLVCSLACLESGGRGGAHSPGLLASLQLWVMCVLFRMPCRKQQTLHSRAFSHFLSRSFGAGIKMFFKPHCPPLVSQEEVGGSLGREHRPKFRDGRRKVGRINS